MKQNRIIIVLIAFVFFSGCDEGEMNPMSEIGSKPNRSECIVGISFSRKDENITIEDNLPYIVEKLIQRLNAVSKERGAEIYPSMSMNWESNVLYVQFPHNCEEKFDYGRDALSSIDIAPFEYEFIHKPITPSISTIDVKGPYWLSK